MGQALGPEFTNCAGHRGEDHTGGGNLRNLVEESLEKWDARGGVLDRADLLTRWSRKSLEAFIRVQEPLVMHTLAISDGGAVEIDGKSGNFGKQVLKIEMPDLGNFCFFSSAAGTGHYFMAISSLETNLQRTLRTYKSVEALVEKVHEFLMAGAESLEVTIGQEMFCAEYDMSAILSELEKRSFSARSRHSRSWIITSYGWMVSVSYKFCPTFDPLKKYVTRLSERKQTKEQLLREMRNRTVVSRDDIERFAKFATEDDAIPAAEQYMHMMVDQATGRRFTIERTVEQEGSPRQSVSGVVGMSTKHKAVEGCIMDVLEQLREESLNIDNWQFMIGWEPVQVQTVQEAMHEAQRHLTGGNQMNYMRFALKAATLAGDDASRSPGRGVAGTQGLSEQQLDSTIAAGKTMIDDMIDRFHRGEFSRERFEEQFSELCDTMVHMLETHLLPYGDGPQHKAMCCRQIADYRRYAHVFIARRRTNEKLISDMYAQAEEYSKELPPRCMAGLSSCVNYAVYFAEVLRDTNQAAQACRRHLEYGRRYRSPMADDELSTKTCNPSEVFNWSLLQYNLMAFETRFVLIRVSFRLGRWLAYREQVAKRMAARLGGGAAAEEPAPEAQAAAEWESEAGGRAPAAEGREEDPWPAWNHSAAENWKSLKGTFGEKARHCFDNLPGSVSDLRNLTFNGDSQQNEMDLGRARIFTDHSGSSANIGRQATSRRRAVSEVVQAPPTEQAVLDIATMDCWLASRPLRGRGGENEESDQEAENKGPQPDLRQVRWIAHAEAMSEVVEESVEPERELTKPTELFQRGVGKVRASNALRRTSTGEASSCSFLVGCIVRRSPSALAQTNRGKNQYTWAESLEKDLKAWPGDGPDNGEPRIFQVYLRPELDVILESIDSEGMLQEDVASGTTSAVSLHPGDVLLPPDEYSGQHDALERFLKDLKSPKAVLPLKLKFQPCLQVNSARWQEEGPYTDHHTRFVGFPGGQGNLQTSSEFASFDDMLKDLHALRKRSVTTHGQRLPPRRIRGMSARRSPLQAATRGCK